jgi:iron complex transport system substrate-binding protein
MRIVSLLPSATEILCSLGLEEAVVAVSHSCDYPAAAVTGLPRITATRVPHDGTSWEIDNVVRGCLENHESLYTVDLELLASLAPDLVVTQGLCEVCAVGERELLRVIRQLPRGPAVLSLEPRTLSGVFDSILRVGSATGRRAAADRLVGALRRRTATVADRSKRLVSRPRVVLLEWLDPPIACGHWNPELVELAGGIELLGRAGEPSRGVTWDDVGRAQPDVLCVASCGYPVARTRAELLGLVEKPALAGLTCVAQRRVYALDGVGLFSRPGPRVVESLELLAGILDPGAAPAGSATVWAVPRP